ncbi:MAG: SusC/RagA family TonB-linked outer membrane protein, partial [Bacteroidales bacterium]|nr:SusC/RagA family TonB-linked outer membrane protein [Bacteroidales bacterium]
MRKRLTVLFIAFLIPLSGLLAQVRVTGRVVSKTDNSPLPGVNVIVKSSGLGTITNMDGRFGIAVKDEHANDLELIFSFIGMETQTVKVEGREYIEVYMDESINQLEQIVITSSYGTQKLKEEVVGSIETLTSKDIQVDQAFESVDKMLEGQIADVNMETGSGTLAPVKINIRGQGSLTPMNNNMLGTSTQPLIIIDGVIMTEEMAIDNSFFDGSGTGAENFNNPLGQLAPEDIESFNVLKDAAAVSIYGADGANGVILITTKKGKAGKTKFNFSTQHGMSMAINQIKYMNGEQYTEAQNAFLADVGASPVPYNGVNTDWFNELNENGSFHKYALSVSGGGEKLTFRTSLNYLNIQEPQKGNSSNQYRMSTGLVFTQKRFKATLSLNPSIIQKEAPNIYYNYAFVPTVPIRDEEGNYTKMGVPGLGNPFAAIEQNMYDSETKGILSSLKLDYEILKDWTVLTLFGLDYKDKVQDRYFSGANESGQYNGTFQLDGIEYPKWGRRLINYRQTTSWNWQGQTSYSKQITEEHYFDVLAGIELAEQKVDLDYERGQGFVNPDIVNPVSNALQDDDPKTLEDDRYKNQTYTSDISYNSRVSMFAQLNYDYKKKYFILANFRRDESSVFGDDTNVAYNGGLGASWIISKESFLENQLWLDFLRLRLSYGTTGNSRIGSYSAKGLYSYSENGGYNKVPYATPQSAPNANLSWETNKKFNVGLDINMVSRFNLTVEYFYDSIEDMISSRDVPSETGYTSVQINGTDMYNKGLEASFKAQIIKHGDFKWRANFNIATLKNKITSVKDYGDDTSSAATAAAIKQGYST